MEFKSLVNAICSAELVLINDIPETHGKCSRWGRDVCCKPRVRRNWESMCMHVCTPVECACMQFWRKIAHTMEFLKLIGEWGSGGYSR